MDLAELKSRDVRDLPDSMSERDTPHLAYTTGRGEMYHGEVEEVLQGGIRECLKGEVKLLFTSPPFPLNKKKSYGNRTGEAYLRWLADFAPLFSDLLTDDGSIVLEVGNSWEPGKPIMSTLPLEALLRFKEEGDLHLCQMFVGHNKARLPSPAQWVNIERIRVKDAFTNIWWMAPEERPDADNRRVLQEYSDAMQKLLDSGEYNSGERPSEHHIGDESFLEDNEGSIPPNVLEFSNTASRGPYLDYCRSNDIEFHPARMAPGLAEFFVKFLTKPTDLVLDPFAGSNTTGAVAEELNRRWLSVEPQWDYVRGSVGRFEAVNIPENLVNGHRASEPLQETFRNRCKATADHTGDRCSFRSLPASEYCGHHLPGNGRLRLRENGSEPIRCQATTQRGTQCFNRSKSEQKFCGIHLNGKGDGER